MRLGFFLVLSATLLISCKEDDDSPTPTIEVTDLGIATGVVLTDANGQGIGSVGNPNWYNGLILYPNPPADVQTAALQSGENIREVNIIPAIKNTDFSDAQVMDAFNMFEGYPLGDVQAAAVKSLVDTSNNQQVAYSLQGLTAGYYRVIVTSGSGDQHGSTIFIDSTLSYPTGLRDFLVSDWQ